jgi:hypothetical protein
MMSLLHKERQAGNPESLRDLGASRLSQISLVSDGKKKKLKNKKK